MAAEVEGAGLERVRLQLKWKHQFQFAGYYAAIEKGYFREAGLEVTLIEPAEGEDPADVVVNGAAEYGIGTSELIVSRARGLPVMVLAAVYQHSPYGIVSLKGRGLDSIHDLVGRRMMVETQAAEVWAYLRQERIATDRITLLPHNFDIANLLSGAVDAMTVYSTDEPFALEEAGVAYQLFSARSAGIDFYGDVLFTTETEVRRHPERVAALLGAVRRGWQYALAHPEEIARLVHERWSARKSIPHLLFEAEHGRSLMVPDVVEFGYMHEGRWRHIADTYASLGMMERDFPLDGFLYRPDAGVDRGPLYRVIAGLAAGLVVVGGVGGRFYVLSRRLRREVMERLAAQREANEALVQERNLLAILAHDFRTPLAVISASTQLLGLFPAGDDARGRRELGKIAAAAATLDRLIGACLARDRLGSIDPGAFAPVDVADVLAGVTAERCRLGDGGRIVLAVGDGRTMVAGDAGLLGITFANLIDNALKYSEGGVDVALARAEGLARVTVRDDGPGIRAEDREHVFEKYWRAADAPAGKGAGLGLHVVRGIVTAHGGTVEAIPHAGGEFVVTLPLLPEAGRC